MRFIRGFLKLLLIAFLMVALLIAAWNIYAWANTGYQQSLDRAKEAAWRSGSSTMCLYIATRLNDGLPDTESEALAWIAMCNKHTDFLFGRDPADWIDSDTKKPIHPFSSGT